MTNPDNVGGLPELPAWMDDYKIPCDAFDGSEDVRLSDRMRAYGELCRAAPAGGDAEVVRLRQLLAGTQEQFRVVSELLERNQAHHERMMKLMDSAPAGGDDWNAAIEAAANEADHWQSRSGSGHACGQYIAGAIRGLKRDSAPAHTSEARDAARRWCIEQDGADLLVCTGDHHRSQDCEFVRYAVKEDSAPAGSGEVDGGPMLSMYWTLLSASLTARKLGLEATEDSILEVLDAVWMGLSEQERDTARDPALLRKLQQGVE